MGFKPTCREGTAIFTTERVTVGGDQTMPVVAFYKDDETDIFTTASFCSRKSSIAQKYRGTSEPVLPVGKTFPGHRSNRALHHRHCLNSKFSKSSRFRGAETALREVAITAFL